MDNARFLVEKELVELPVEPDEMRRAFLNVQATEDRYEHASRALKDVFDAMALAMSEVKSEQGGRSMDLLAAKQRAPRGGVGRRYGLR